MNPIHPQMRVAIADAFDSTFRGSILAHHACHLRPAELRLAMTGYHRLMPAAAGAMSAVFKVPSTMQAPITFDRTKILFCREQSRQSMQFRATTTRWSKEPGQSPDTSAHAQPAERSMHAWRPFCVKAGLLFGGCQCCRKPAIAQDHNDCPRPMAAPVSFIHFCGRLPRSVQGLNRAARSRHLYCRRYDGLRRDMLHPHLGNRRATRPPQDRRRVG